MQTKASQARKAIGQLIKRDLATVFETTSAAKVWREDGDRRFGAAITEAGAQAIGVTNPPPQADSGVTAPIKPEPASIDTAIRSTASALRTGTKQAKVVELLKRENGASLDELVQATGWLPHTTRAALTGIRKRGILLDKSKVDGVTRYRALGAAA